MKKSFALLLLGLVQLPIASEAQTKLSLKNCISYGLQHHGSVRLATVKESIAKEQAREALSGYLPQVNASGSLDDNIKLQSTVLPGSFVGSTEDVRVKMGTKYSSLASAQADQVVYDQALLTGLKANKPNLQNAQLNTVKTRENIIYDVANKYYQVFVTRQQIDLLKDNLEKTGKLLGILKLQLDNGVVKKVDYDRTQVSLNNIRSQLTLAESNLELSENQLKFSMGMPVSEPITLTDSLPAPVILAEYGEFVAANLTDYKTQQVGMRLQQIEKDRIKAGYLPKLSVYGRYGLQSLGNNLGRSWENWFGFGSIGLKLNIPIFDSFKRDAQWKQARLNLIALEEQLKLNVQSYELQNHNSKTQLQKARLNLANDDQNVKLAREVYDVTTLQYQQGTLPLSDLLNAEMSYKEAQTNYISTMLSYYQARLGLEQSQGTLNTFFEQLD